MKLPRRTRRPTAWIAIFAVLVAALAPSMARAFSPPQQALSWTEICTATGIQLIPDAEPMSGGRQQHGTGFQHCSLCPSHAGHLVLPSGGPDYRAPAAGASAEAFPPSEETPPPRFIRAVAQPRAPPANS